MKTMRGDLIPTTQVWSSASTCLALLRPFFLAAKLSIFILWLSPLIANSHSLNSPPLSCISYVQLSLPAEGQVTLKPQLFLAGTYPDYSIFTVDVVGPLTDIVGCDQIGESLMVKIMDDQGNSCWSNLTIEDKAWPEIICDDIEIPCNQDISEEDFNFFIDVSDNCTPLENLSIYYNESLNDSYCDPDYVATINRTWFVSDQYGNQSSCSQAIRFTRLNIADVQFPDDVTVSCVNLDIEPSNTGEPMLDGTPILDFCEIIKWKSDSEIPLPCEGEFKIIRTWTVMDWCSVQMRDDEQEILVVDDVAPEMECPPDMTVSTKADDCHADFTIPDITVSDFCSADINIVISVRVNGIFGFSVDDVANLDLGNNVIIYTATDPCGNSETCELNVFVEDNIVPVLDCGSPLQIPLMNNDMVTVNANAFEFYFFDNCGLNDVKIRKLFDSCGNPDDLVFGDTVSFCCADAGGTVSVELLVFDIFGNSNSCIFQVDIKDSVPPTVSCQDITVQLNNQGDVTINLDELVEEAMDNCALKDTSASQTIFDCNNVGQTMVEVTVTDVDDNTATCLAVVTVQDTTAPMANCKDITINLDDTGNIIITPSEIDNMSSDACGIGNLSIDNNSFNCSDIGELNPVVLTVTDVNDNSATCSANVTVVDVTAPICSAQDITVTIVSGNLVSFTAEEIDNGSFDICSDITLSVSPNSFTCAELGENPVILTVTDNSGNSSSCDATVYVQDLIAPNCIAQDITVTLDEFGMVSITGMDVDNMSNDDCGTVENLEVIPNSFGCADIGDNMVELTVTDNNGNQSTCTATVTVEDTVPPDCFAQDITITLDANGEFTITPDQIDNESMDLCGVISSKTLDQTLFTCLDLGSSNTVVLTVTDNSGNSSSCSANVTVIDILAPVCMTQDVTLYVDESGMASLSVMDVDNGSVDTCGMIVDRMVSPSAFNCANVNMPNTTTLTLTDENGNISMCDANVTVLDTIPPLCDIMDITVQLDAMGEASITGDDLNMGSSDNCNIVSITSQPNTFFCNDIGANAVIVTVMDQSGNMSTCAAVVQVDDVIDPIINCPKDTIVECTEDFSNLNIFGIPMVQDECGISSLVEDVNMSTNACNIGTIIRTFTVEDNDGNENFCQQFITVNPPQNPLTLSDITWPQMVIDATMNCTSLDPSMLPGGFPIVDVSMVDCSLVTINYEDMTSSGGCACNEAVTRTWTVVDSCTFNPINMDGVFTFVQTINVVDMEDPILILPPAVDTILAASECDAFLDIDPAMVLDCNDVTITNDSPFALSNGDNASGTYDVGVTVVTFMATDCCGLSASSTLTVTVHDTVPPQIVCDPQFMALIEVDDQVTIIPGDLLLSATDNCIDSADLNYSFSFVDPNVGTLQFLCGDIGPNVVDVYVTDGFNNVDSCQVTVTVADPSDFCNMNRFAHLGGAIFMENGAHLMNVDLKLEGYMTAETKSNESGDYMFDDLIMHQAYSIIPNVEGDWLNGVTAWDMVLIQRHIIGLEYLNSPYKMIAADVNDSKSISVSDLVLLQKLILGISEDLPGNKSWRFIQSQYEFLDIENPLKENFPEGIQVGSLDNDIYNANFMAVKSGDVNYTAQPNNFKPSVIRTGLEKKLIIEDRNVYKGEAIEISVKLQDEMDLSAFQMSLFLNGLIVEDIETDLGIELRRNQDYIFNEFTGELKILWTEAFPYNLKPEDSFLLLKTKVQKNGRLSNLMHLTKDSFPSILFDPSGREASVAIEFRDLIGQTGIKNIRSMPNPFSDHIQVQFELSERNSVEVHIADVLGQLVRSASIQMEKGKNNITISAGELPGPGIYHVQIRTKSDEATTRIMLIN